MFDQLRLASLIASQALTRFILDQLRLASSLASTSLTSVEFRFQLPFPEKILSFNWKTPLGEFFCCFFFKFFFKKNTVLNVTETDFKSSPRRIGLLDSELPLIKLRAIDTSYCNNVVESAVLILIFLLR